MVLEFRLEERLPVSATLFFQLFFVDGSFHTTFHQSKGDQDVVVSDWIELGKDTYQRVCFYTMIEKAEDSEEKQGTRCLETQRRWTNEAGEFQIASHIVPENPLGNIFKIEANWSAVDSPEPGRLGLGTTLLTIQGMVECKKKVWGVQGMAERWLKQAAVEIHAAWIRLALEHINQKGVWEIAQKAGPVPAAPSTNAPTGIIADGALTNMTQAFFGARNRFGERIISGTEKVVSMLAQGSLIDSLSPSVGSAPHPSLSSMLADPIVKEGCFSSISISIPSPQDEHDDSDLAKPRRRPRNRQCAAVLLIAGVVSVVLMTFIALFSR